MKNTSFSIRIYSYYLFVLGAVLVFIPNLLLPFLGFSVTNEIWIKMLGLFTFTVGIYYFYSSVHKQTGFFKATIFGRLFFFIMTVCFVFIFRQPTILSLIGSVDLFGALWTYVSFKKEKLKTSGL